MSVLASSSQVVAIDARSVENDMAERRLFGEAASPLSDKTPGPATVSSEAKVVDSLETVSGGAYNHVSSSSSFMKSTSIRPNSSNKLALKDSSLRSSGELILDGYFTSLLFFSDSTGLIGN